MLWVFWIAVVFLAYVFAGYPLLLAVVGGLRRRGVQRAPIEPLVSIIIPAHNEETTIGRKIENTLALEYPEEKREIIVASDGSSDGTAEVIRSYAARGVRLLEQRVRLGKHHVQMLARDMARGEILVFTDASVELEPQALRRIVSNFADPSVGCVSSEDAVAGSQRWMGERFYVMLEMRLRRLEAAAGSLVGLSGSFFAARREVCRRWNPHQSSDFFLPLEAARLGMRTVVDPECRGHYGLVPSERAELQRKVRTIVHGIDVLFEHAGLLNPFRHGFFALQLISHKLFRWLVPFAAAALLLATVFLWDAGPFYQSALVLQAGLYGGGLLAITAKRVAEFKAFRLAGFFLMGNAATVMAWMYYFAGEKFVTWQPSRRS